MNSFTPLAALAGLLLCGASARAQSPDPGQQPSPSPVVTLSERVVVAASRVGQDLADSPSGLLLLTRADLDRSPALSVADELRSVPGFTQRPSSSLLGRVQNQFAAFRGLQGGSSRALILLDGVPLVDGFAGWPYWSRVPSEGVERVEVARGGGASAWGNLALTGVVNIVTLAPKARHGRLSAEAGEHGTLRAAGYLSERLGRLGVARAGDYHETEGYHDVHSGQRGPIDAEINGRHRTVDLRLDYQPDERVLLSLRGGLFSEDRFDGQPFTESGSRVDYLRGGLALAGASGSRLEAVGFASAADIHGRFASIPASRASFTPASEQLEGPSNTLGGSLIWTSRALGAHRLTVGADGQRVTGDALDEASFSAGRFTLSRRAGGTHRLLGSFVQDLLSVGRYRIAATLRLDDWRTSDGYRQETDLASGRITRDERALGRGRTTPTGSLGVKRTLGAGLALRGMLYRSFRAPNLRELTRPVRSGPGVIEPRFDLRPETLLGSELGVDYDAGGASAHATLYWNRLDDFVAPVTVARAGATGRVIPPCGFISAGAACLQYTNLARVRSLGIEAGGGFSHRSGFALGMDYALNRTEVVEAGGEPQLLGNEVRLTPRHHLALRARYTRPRFEAAVSGRYLGSRWGDDLNSFRVRDSFVVDLRLSRRLHERVQAFASVENLFDSVWEIGRDTNGLITVGTPREARAGIRFRY